MQETEQNKENEETTQEVTPEVVITDAAPETAAIEEKSTADIDLTATDAIPGKKVAARMDGESKWYSLRVISGKEKSIKERIEKEIEINNWGAFVFNIIVPTEKVYKILNGKKVVKERNLLPGYILVEAISGKLNGDVSKTIADITNVIHFLGKETPLPMTQIEANRLLGKVDESAESGEMMLEPYLMGETVKIIDGPFADFIGDIQEVNEEKKKLKVVVKIFGRGTEVELNFMQVEKIS